MPDPDHQPFVAPPTTDSSYRVPDPRSTNKWCVAAFVSSLVFCCPLTSVIGLGLGVFGSWSVLASRAQRGLGYALSAIVIALASLTAQFFVAQAVKPYADQLYTIISAFRTGPKAFFIPLQDGDWIAARRALLQSTSDATTDAMLADFASRVEEQCGRFIEWDFPDTVLFGPNGRTNYSEDFQNTAQFEKGEFTLNVRYTLIMTPDEQVEDFGIQAITIGSFTQGEIIFDPNGVLPQSKLAKPGEVETSSEDN